MSHYQAIQWIQEKCVEKYLEKEGEKEIVCLHMWTKQWTETFFWNDIIHEYVDTLSKDTQQEIVCKVGLTNTIHYMIKDLDGAVFFRTDEINDYEGLLCVHALDIMVRENLYEMYEYYLDKMGGNCSDCSSDCEGYE